MVVSKEKNKRLSATTNFKDISPLATSAMSQNKNLQRNETLQLQKLRLIFSYLWQESEG